MDFKYIKNIADDGTGTILLYNQIGDSIDANGNYTYGISGELFAYEMQYLQTQCSKINVRINSIGGSVLDGYSIISSILNATIPVDTYIDGLAASISGVIAVAGKKCYMMDYGTLMMHNPSGGNDKAVTALVKETLVMILSNRTAKTPEEIDTMMNAETWLSSNEALSMGLVDEIVSSGKKLKMQKTDSLYNMALVYNKLINPKTQQMEKVTNFLKLKNEASEDEIVSAIEQKDTEMASKDAEIASLNERIAKYEEAEKAAKDAAIQDMKNKATLLVKNAVKEGKIEAEKETEMVELAISNFSLVENMIGKINNIKNAVKPFNIENTKKETEKSEWTIRDWEKKDPKGLEKIKNETPEVYQTMYNAYYTKP